MSIHFHSVSSSQNAKYKMVFIGYSVRGIPATVVKKGLTNQLNGVQNHIRSKRSVQFTNWQSMASGKNDICYIYIYAAIWWELKS